MQFLGGQELTKTAAAAALRKRHDIVIWSGHGAPGELFGPGWKVQPEWIAVQARCGLPRLLVLAACGSGLSGRHVTSLASEVSRNGINTVAFPMQADDRAAMVYNQELIGAAVAGTDMWSAHRVALEAIRDEWPDVAKSVTLLPGFTDGMRDFIVRIEGLEGHVTDLCTRMAGLEQSMGLLLQHFHIC